MQCSALVYWEEAPAAPATRPDSHGQPTHLHPHQAEGGRGAMWWPGRLPAAAPGQGRSGVAGSAEYVAIGVRVGMRDLENVHWVDRISRVA
ncbi:hypothetical protein BC936DRAFT_148333 [Jimgerdemannia flammicorona]|uniref:Uncharacterized protein n=1 Tax=Jimgerdemannia flammicorona TaxID=994334 RepID=A0A433DKS3_9FUNG|nr:hypothetical protein BC936DRAFT_148333 [Jimgerdemannia flammicorona]